jgi:hypothetical protein
MFWWDFQLKQHGFAQPLGQVLILFFNTFIVEESGGWQIFKEL